MSRTLLTIRPYAEELERFFMMHSKVLLTSAIRSHSRLLFPLCSFLYTTVFWMILAFLPVFLKDRQMADPVIGMVFGAYSISALLLMLPLGLLADRFSPKRILLFGALLTLIHIEGLKLAATAWQFVALAVCGGMGWATFQIVLLALYLKVIGEQQRGRNVAFYTTGQFLGFGAGPLLAGMLWGEINYAQLMTIAEGACLLLTLAVCGLEDSTPIRFDWGDYRRDLRKPHIVLFLLVYFFYATHLGVEHTAFTLLMKDNLAFSGRQIGLVFFAVGLWMGFLSPVAGHRFDVGQNLLPFLFFGLLISAVFQVMTGYAEHPLGMAGVRILHTLGDTPVLLAMGILTAAFFPVGRLGGNSAAVYTVRTLGVFIGNVGAGALAPLVGYDGVFMVSGLFLMALTLLFYPKMRRYLTLGTGNHAG